MYPVNTHNTHIHTFMHLCVPYPSELHVLCDLLCPNLVVSTAVCVCVRAYARACVRACVCASLLFLGDLFCCTVELSLLLSLLLYWFKRTLVDQILFLCNHASSKLRGCGTLVTSDHGQARLWDLFGPDEPLGSFPLTQNLEEQVVALSTDRENHVLVAGDTAGLIAVFDMKDYCMVTGKVSTTTTMANDVFSHCSDRYVHTCVRTYVHV